jgi:glycosyltransferase involved in cell wall biosynthesis
LLVPPADEARLAAAMASLLTDRAAATRIGSSARDAVATRFTSEIQLARLTELVAEHLAPRGARMIGGTGQLACQR